MSATPNNKMQEYFTPEVIVFCLSVSVVTAITVVTGIVLCKDQGLRNVFTRLKNYTSNYLYPQRQQNKKTKKITTTQATTLSTQATTQASALCENGKNSDNMSWEEIFKVSNPIGTTQTQYTNNNIVRLGTCIRCKLYSAKINCKLNACGICCRSDPQSVCRAHGTGYQSALNELNTAIQYGYIEVDISYSNLKLCPPIVTSLSTNYLVSLNLSNNRLSTIPEDIGLLKGLKELFLQYNYLSQLPESICLLINLVELDIKNNMITFLPLHIGRLKQLIVFCAMNNMLTSLPNSIGELNNLEELSLLSNNLQFLPEDICHIHSLKLFYCGENQLKSLPDNFGELIQLEELDLSHNQLVMIPRSICYCHQLIRLWLIGNRLIEIPSQIGLLDNLKELHVRNNCLKYFPVSIQQLPLYTFTAQNNPILKEHQIRTLNHTPRLPFPPLIELAARSVATNNVNKGGVIPYNLEEMLSKRGILCSQCGQRVFIYYTCNIHFEMVGVYYRLPLYEILCSPHNGSKCV